MTTLLKPYSIVEFVSRGRKRKQRSVDIVPTKWTSINQYSTYQMDFNKSRKKGTTKFLSAIENEEDKRLIHDIVKDLSDPPESWTIFSVIILGDADTYENAEEKVVRLEAENHIFSLESGEELEKRQSKVLKEIKRQKRFKEEADLNTLLEPSLEEIESDDDGDLKLGYSSEKKHFFDSDLSDDNFSNLANKEEQSDQVNIKTYSKLNNLSYSSKNPGVFPHVEMHNTSSKSSDPLEISVDLPVINIPSVQSVQEFQTQVLANLTMILSELKVTNNRLDNIDKYLCDNSVNQINKAFNVIDFEKKYNIKLPIEEKSIFISLMKL